MEKENQNKINKKINRDEYVRLNKFLSDAGVCSRREADRMIEQGRVTVDGVTASMGMKILPFQSVIADGKKVEKEEK
ncbi:MAG: S4 domain-containing protein, partial [Lachnospiraceae bacterium]